MRPKTITLAIVCAVAMAGLFGASQQPSSGQNAPFKSYQLRVYCDDSRVATATFWHDVKEESMGLKSICAGNCPGGTVPLADALAGLPAEVSAALKSMVEKQAAAGKGRSLACVLDDKKPPEDKKTKCEPPPPESNNPPWFNRDSSCRDRRRATISWSQTRASNMDVSFTVDICGEVIRYITPGGGSPERNPPGVRSFDVCCDSWRKAANTKSPCDARRDFDCDGYLNESDTMPDYAFRERRPDDFTSNSPLTGLPFWKKLHEPIQSGCKDCKWELVRVEYTCKEEFDPIRSAGKSRNVFDAKYDYQATWKCPANGQSQVEKNSATMQGLRCPTPPKRSWP